MPAPDPTPPSLADPADEGRVGQGRVGQGRVGQGRVGGALIGWATFLTNRYRVCLAAVLLITGVLSAGLPNLGFDIQPNATFKSDNQASRDLRRMHATFGPDDNDVVILIEGDGLLETESLTAMRALRDDVRAIRQVESVSSILDLRKPGRLLPLIPRYPTEDFDSGELLSDLQSHPLSAGQLISPDGSIVMMLVRIRGGSLSVSSIVDVIDPIEDCTAHFEATVPSKVRLAGHPAVRADVLVTLQRAMMVSCSAAVVIALLVAISLFRRVAPVLVVVSAPAIGAVWTFGLIAWAGEPVGGILTALPNLVFVVGLTDAVHVVLEYRRQLRLDRPRREAVYQALIDVGPACFLTSLTTLIGFGSLLVSSTESVQQFGFWAATGTSLALLAVVFALPTILMVLPAAWMIDRRGSADRLRDGLLTVVEPTLRRPRLTTLVAILLTSALLYPALNQRPDIVWTEAIPDDSPSVVAMNLADEKIGGGLAAYVMITWPEGEVFPSREVLAAIARTQLALRDAQGFTAAFSVLNLIAAAPGRDLAGKYRNLSQSSQAEVDRWVSLESRTTIVSARVPNDGASALNRRLFEFDQKMSELSERFPGFDFRTTGSVVAASQNMNAIIIDLARSLAIAGGLIFVVFVFAFRSLRIGILSVVPNMLPLIVTAAGLHLFGLPLQMTSAVTFSLCLGLAVDDTIHVLTRFRAIHRCEPDPLVAMRTALSQVGPALIVTTMILLGGFAALMVSPLPSIRLFSVLSAVTVLTALVGDLFLFPAMLLSGTKRT